MKIFRAHTDGTKMKKTFLSILLTLAACFVAPAQETRSGVPSYDNLQSSAMDAVNRRDYRSAYNTYCLMDSAYGITSADYLSMMYYVTLTHVYNPGGEAEKRLMFRAAGSKWFDMAHLEREAADYAVDTLDYWDELVALVSPRGYQDTVYQNRLLAMKRAEEALRHPVGDVSLNGDSRMAALLEVEARNEAELKRLIAERGFPTLTRVGSLCNDHATYIAQFMSEEFKRWYFKEALAAIAAGDYNDGRLVRYIVDREDIGRGNLNETYRGQLKAMCEEDQRLRRQLPKDGAWPDSLGRAIHKTDSLNTVKLRELIDQYGFPTYDNVGRQGVDDAWLLAQHAEPGFLRWFLELAKPAADNGLFDPVWIAYMTDRDLDHQGKPQLYGTQGLTLDGLTGMYLIDDVGRLDERRRSAGMGPIEDYLPHMNMPDFYFHPSLVDYRQYSLNLRIEGDTLRVSGFYLNPYNTTAYAGQPVKVDTAYSLPLADYRMADGAIVLRREGDWYPHRNGELLTAQVHIKADDYHIIGGTEWLPSFDIHLVLLPKDKYSCKVIDSPIRPFRFYRPASDTTQYPEAYYNEFVDSYNFYCSFFGDSLSSKPMNIVEIGDPQFVMCQGLRDMIIFGHYFYDVYTMIPDFSWIPHEVAHQWWGGGVFFEYRDYALSESPTEYIKLQYLKSRGRGYKEQIEYYKATMERAGKSLPIADIRSFESQDESIAIYHTAPYRLTLMDSASVNTALRQLYSKYKHTMVSRENFLRECKTLRDWLMSEK